MTGNVIRNGNDDPVVEHKPMFHEWATVQPGMICLARKKKTAVFRQYVAAETAVPVIACAACLPYANEKDCAQRVRARRPRCFHLDCADSVWRACMPQTSSPALRDPSRYARPTTASGPQLMNFSQCRLEV
jgi:hypothetical protein